MPYWGAAFAWSLYSFSGPLMDSMLIFVILGAINQLENECVPKDESFH
jgi:hypothetical protein